MIQPTIAQQQQPTSHTEEILVVKRSLLFFEQPAWHGLKTDCLENYVSLINAQKEFLPRWQMENDPTYKQIIPYLIFTHENSYFLMQRRSTASEVRLQNKFSLGIGGHIRQTDIQGNDIFAWAQREFHEEVSYQGTLTIEPLGILNDDSDSVGKVHLGLVLLLKGDSGDIRVRSELKSGRMASLEECTMHLNNLENWSALVLKHLATTSPKPQVL